MSPILSELELLINKVGSGFLTIAKTKITPREFTATPTYAIIL